MREYAEKKCGLNKHRKILKIFGKKTFEIKQILKVWSTNKMTMDVKKQKSKNIEMSKDLIGCWLMKLLREGWSNFRNKTNIKS